MDADHVGRRAGPAVVVGHDGVEVADLAQAVTAQGQRAGVPTDAVLAGVEGVAPVERLGAVPVGHHHLRQPRPVQDGSAFAVVVVGHLVQNQAVGRVHRDPDAPLLPGHQIPLDREAGPLGLRDLQRLEVRAQPSHRGGVVVARFGGDGDDVAVEHLHHPLLVQVHNGDHVLEGLGVPVVGRGRPHIRGGPHQAAVGVDPFDGEVAHRPEVHLHRVEVADTSPAYGSAPRLVTLHEPIDRRELLHQDGRLDPVQGAPRNDPVGVEGNNGLVGAAVGAVQQGRPGTTADRIAGAEPAHLLLRRFLQHQQREPQPLHTGTVTPDDRRRLLDLGGGQRVQRVSGSPL